ncbi:hypothetical protein DFH06DRAFT_1397028 [Mycena polygramma]|nr:hypothetical protein DFH06DRAFT_1397028 [Mycena polygramma]
MADLTAILGTLVTTLQQLAGVQNAPAPTPAPTQPTLPPVPVLPTPPITLYTSARAPALPPSSLGHPAPSGHAPSYQPMLGVAGLGIHMGGHSNNPRISHRGTASGSQLTAPQISQANAGRQNAISAHFPATTSLVQRGKRRGAAIHPPTLNRGPPPTLLETVSFIDATGTRMLRVRFEVLPPTIPAGSDHILARRLRTSELGFLTAHNLLYNFVLPETTSVVDLLRMGARAMQDGPGAFVFDTVTGTRASRHLPHETMPLHLLSLINKGNPRSNGVSYLTSRHPVGVNMTIVEFTHSKMRSKFGHPSLCVEHTDDGDHLVVRAAIRRPGVTFNTSDDGAWPRTHTCLSIRHSHYIDEATEGDFVDDSDSTERLTSGGEPELASDEEEDENMDVQLPPTPTPAPHPRTIVRARSLQEFGIPSKIFAVPFVPRAGPYHDVFEAPDLLKAVYELASGEVRAPLLEVQGTDLDSMVTCYKDVIGTAADSGDYSRILSPRRNFKRMRLDGTTLSFGIGPEKEVLYALWQTFARHPERYFIYREEGRCAISTTVSMAQRFLVSPARIRELRILGVVLVLMLLHGMVPAPVTPALFQFVFNGRDLDSITREFLREWNPLLLRVIDEWIRIGPNGDVAPFTAHFGINHDLQVASLESRDQSHHDAVGADIVYTSIFGSQPPTHPEPNAVFTGMEMQCSNGFNMCDLFRSFPGGTERLLSQKWTSLISNYDSIEPNLEITCPSAVDVSPLLAGLSVALDVADVLPGFLQRTGIPCSGLFAKMKSTIHPIVPLLQIDAPSFRPQMLAWARGAESKHTIAFRSCLQSGRIPLSYLIQLHHASYPALDASGQPTEPLTLQDAIDEWLLRELVGAVGDLSFV